MGCGECRDARQGGTYASSIEETQDSIRKLPHVYNRWMPASIFCETGSMFLLGQINACFSMHDAICPIQTRREVRLIT